MITVIQPDVTVPLDYFQEWLEQTGHELRIIQTELEPVPHISEVGDGIVVLGGRMNIFATDEHPHLDDIRQLIRDAVDSNVPLFGICLGHQLLADALGGTVIVGSDQDEHGPVKVTLNNDGKADQLFSHVYRAFGETFDAAASHNDCVTHAPEGATVLASNDQCGIQAFRVGSAFSVQFHPEVSTDTMCFWQECHGDNPEEMRTMLTPYQESISKVGKTLATAFGEATLKK